MTDIDVISLSSDSSRPSSPFINVSEVLNDSEKPESSILKEPIILSPLKNRIVHDLSESEDSEFESFDRANKTRDNLNDPNADIDKVINNTFCNTFSKNTNSNVLEKNLNVQWHEDNPSTSGTFNNDGFNCNKNNIKNKTKTTNEQRIEEKLRKQREKELLRAEKNASKELLDQMKPNNCMKYMTVILDSTLITCPFSGALIAAVQNSESKYEVSTQPVPLTVFWRRETPGPNIKEEKDLLLIWHWELVVPAIKQHTLISQVQDIQAQYPSKCIFLVIYGLNGYFSYLKTKRSNRPDPPKASKRKLSTEPREFPYITKKDIEEELIELEVTTNCSHRLIECPGDLGNLVVQITKAIAETPFKLDKQKRVQENLEWFAAGDSRDCVAVDRAGNGLLRLWQQQLCQFSLAGHDVAQAIAVVYPSPLSLVRAYDNCSSQKECEDLLKDIPVRRCQGPLSSSRRIGPELSKKICTLFCSTDGDAPLSQEH